MADLISPMPARLFVNIDHDTGIQLTSDQRKHLDDVPPGGEYVEALYPRRAFEIHEVVSPDFRLVKISIDERAVEVEIISTEVTPEYRPYRLKPPLIVQAGEIVRLHLRNDGASPRKPQSAVIVRHHGAVVPQPPPPEEAVGCPTCESDPGTSCYGDGDDVFAKVSHPSRIAAYRKEFKTLGQLAEEATRIEGTAMVPETGLGRPEESVACPAFAERLATPPGDAPSDVLKLNAILSAVNEAIGRAGIHCAITFPEAIDRLTRERNEARALAEIRGKEVARLTGTPSSKPQRVFITPTPRDWIVEDIKIGNFKAPSPPIEPGGEMNFEIPASPTHCPTCGSHAREIRYGQRVLIFPPAAVAWCKDAWHDQPQPQPERHAPRIARTLNEGPGNATLIRGCSCGAGILSAEAFAEHVGWPVDAVRVMLGLAGIADDLILHHEQMTRTDVWTQIARCMEVRR